MIKYNFEEFMVIILESKIFYILTLPILLIVVLIWMVLTVISYPFYLLFNN